MALNFIRFPVFFTQGLDTKTDNKLVSTPKLLELENGIFSRGSGDDGGSISKRPGYDVLGNCITGLGITLTTLEGIPTFAVGGLVEGLSGTGLQLANTIDGNTSSLDFLTVNSSGIFSMPTQLSASQTYQITVTNTGSVAQSCTVFNATGTIVADTITNVTVSCEVGFFVGGTVDGLSGSENQISLGLGSNKFGFTPEVLVVDADGVFQFVTTLTTGSSYEVTIDTQPTAQSGTVLNFTGSITTFDITDVFVAITSSQFTVGGDVTAVSGSGLFLQLNGAETLEITGVAPPSIPFQFATTLVSGTSYEVTILTEPTGSDPCTSGSTVGNIDTTNITDVTFSCLSGTSFIGGEVVQLSGSGLILELVTTAGSQFIFITGTAP